MNKRLPLQECLLLIFLAAGLISCKSGPKDYLRQGFINPPDSSKPGVYWYFMDGNTSREGITADLESMKKAGIGYALFLEVNVGVPRGKVDFLSEEWQDLFKHSVREAERLGISIILGSGPGWAGSGGPWVTPSKSMIHLVASDTTISGPGKFRSRLTVPEPKRPFFGEGSLTPGLKKIRDSWYEDEFVLAFPSPRSQSIIPLVDEKALYYRAPFTSQPGVLPYIPALPFYKEEKGSIIESGKIINLTDRLRQDGMLEWDVPPGNWTILRFVRRNNGAVTRPAPMPGLGFECDKFDTASFDFHYKAYAGKLIEKTEPRKSKTGGGWTMIHIDSWEMGSQNWSPLFREEFIKRRGYDPLLYLPVYKGFVVNNLEMSERFLWDVRQTSNELIIENHAGRFRKLGRKNGFRLSIEPYDMNPAADLDLGSVADIPMCEFWSDGYGFNSSFSCIEATSIAHITGASVVAAEAFTADSREAWKKYPGNMKNQGDWAFCMGINRLIYHTFAHKPFGDQFKPGVTMGPYGVHWDRGQTWWPMVTGYHKYISRCQYMLSQGKPVADILYLAPEGAPQVFLPPSSALGGTPVMPDKHGYSFDGCSPAQLIKNARMENGRIVFPSGASYRILVLPDVPVMTPQLLAKVEYLIKTGAMVIGNPPVRSPSLTNYPACDNEIRKLVQLIWGSGYLEENLTPVNYGRGKIWCGKFLKSDSLSLYPQYGITEKILAESGLKKDFSSSDNIRYSHRTLPDREIYFISNKTNTIVEDTCLFRSGNLQAELWNAVTGEIRHAAGLKDFDGRTALPVKLNPYESYFVIFSNYFKTNSVTSEQGFDFDKNKVVLSLNDNWNVTFDTIWGGPANIQLDYLTDLALHNDENVRHYSGIMVYKKSFDLPEGFKVSRHSDLYLNLDKVCNLARVKLNGKDLGVVWTSPWQVKINEAIRKRDNQLEIEVANLWINRLIGDESEPWDGVENGKWPDWLINGTRRPSRRYTFTTHRFYKKDDPLVESGLIGPVRVELGF